MKLDCHFSWQAQDFVTCWEIAEMLYFCIQTVSPRWDEKGLRSGGREMTLLSSDYPRIVFTLEEAIQRVSAEILNLRVRGRGNIW